MKKLSSAILLSFLLTAVLIPQAVNGAPHAAQKQSASKKHASAKEKKKRAALAKRTRRAKRAFVASTDLKPMARQLLENRSPAAYAGVEAYARKHSTTDAGALARLVLGYAHLLDHDYIKALDPLKKARTKADELDDYVTYFLGEAYSGSGDTDHTIATLRDFESKYPDSLFARDATVIYGNALTARERAPEAIALLEARRTPFRSDLELALGRAYLHTGQADQAIEALRRVYYVMPLSAEAEDAQKLLSLNPAPPASFAERKGRADLLMQARRYRDAIDEYRGLLADAAPEDRPSVQLAMGIAQRRSGDESQAKGMLLGITGLPPELEAQRLYQVAEMAKSDEGQFLSAIQQIRSIAPTSPWLEESLLSAGNMYLLARNYDRAIDFYRELQQRFPNGRYGAYAHWKTAWLSFQQGRAADARQGFEEHVTWYPRSPQVPAALYWRARLAEQDGDTGKAQAWYRKIVSRFPNYYYADLAHARLKENTSEADSSDDAVLQKIAPAQFSGDYVVEAPEDDLRVARSRLLRNAAMYDLAAKELQLAGADGGASWASAELARLYQDAGEYHRALETLKRRIPAYYSLELDALPRFYWETLFPRPYWTDLKRFSERNNLDPFLVASLIRQESEFNPGAVSHANALGLMQLLPGTGRLTARELRVRRFRTDQLLTPNMNLQLGTTYFRHMLEHFSGRIEYALAAYNAGTDRVDAWLQDGKFNDPEEFVESIPFTETREYVQAIMRNAAVYRRLYGVGESDGPKTRTGSSKTKTGRPSAPLASRTAG